MIEWIDANERVPEPEAGKDYGTSRYVLILDRWGDMITAWYQHESEYQKARRNKDGYAIGWHGSFTQSDDGPLEEITHWAEKPEGPK